MQGFKITLERRLFSDEVVARAAHRCTHFSGIELLSSDIEIGIVLTPHDGVQIPADVKSRFLNDGPNERLRESGRIETTDIHRELIYDLIADLSVDTSVL
ncbi:hypothetical protein HDC36_001949 [Xanthomonas sp. JAI131]|uniref:hypothetical protein n=1 Tax=unclassified Xanthomonas TaxID=2643310 RepID=UPI0015C70E7F|nr:hypothetical protein [Xanthomonas sp. JAI131]NYF20488.1 hypothetical protein [Xanthomonas sp. JAI131]